MLRRMYIWEIPVRLTHWVNVLSIVILSVTGYYIGNPWILVSSREWFGPFFMGNVRFIHFVFAFVFVASLLLRTYWAFVGNEWSSWRGLFPFLTPEGRRGIVNAIKYYFFLRREPPEVAGHNALAGMTYGVIVFLYFLQAVTGFALLGEVNPAGIWHPLTSWIFRFITNQDLRLVHHLIMWLIFAFVIHHVYAAVLIDNEEGNGVLSSIFSGFKFVSNKLFNRVSKS